MSEQGKICLDCGDWMPRSGYARCDNCQPEFELKKEKERLTAMVDKAVELLSGLQSKCPAEFTDNKWNHPNGCYGGCVPDGMVPKCWKIYLENLAYPEVSDDNS